MGPSAARVARRAGAIKMSLIRGELRARGGALAAYLK